MRIAIISSFILGSGINLGLISSDIFSTSKTIQVKADTVHNYVSYVYCEWDEEEKCVKKRNDEVYATRINSQEYLGDGEWYYWGEGSTAPALMGIHGEANIIINDGHMWRLTTGIRVPEGATLNIYGGPEGTGVISAGPHPYYGAAIGGQYGDDKKSGTINIHGCTIYAYGGDNAAGIGGSEGCNSGDITIYDGDIHVNGSYNGDDGAGIGGGENGSATNITIYGGYVSATGGKNAAGIGGGYKGNSGNIRIYGGTIYGDGLEDGAGIGSGEDGRFENIEIHGGSIQAVGGKYAAAIGSGDFDSATANGTITITGGEISAFGGVDAAGIGGGEYGYGTINISGGTIKRAVGGTDYTEVAWETVVTGGAGIGGGYGAPGGTINISGGTIESAEGGYGGAGIGSGKRKADNDGGTIINISGSANITAVGGEDAAGIGGGHCEEYPTINISGGIINATGGASGAGIGGGKGAAGNITISGGNITATAGTDSDGIGCGKSGYGSHTATIRLRYDDPKKPFSVFSNSFYNSTYTSLIMENPFIDANNVVRYGAGTYTKTALNPLANITLTPEIRPILTLDPGCGIGDISSEAVDYGLVYTLPSSDTFPPETSACTFNNWQITTSDNVFTRNPGETITITKDTYITATWTWDQSELFNYVDKFLEVVSCVSSNEPTFDEGWSWERLKNEYDALSSHSKYALKNAPANENGDSVEKTVKIYDYIVGKFYKNGINLSYIDFFDRNPETVTVYSITYNLNGGIVSTPNPTSYDYATETFTLNNPTKHGCEFEGWYEDDITNCSKEVTITKGVTTGDKVFNAKWKLNENLQEIINMIDDIGEVSYPDSKDKIIAARNAYDLLLEDDKSLITNYSTLEAAEARYSELVNKKAQADKLIALIEAVGDEVSYPDSKEAIQKVLDFYDDLDQETLAFVGQPTLSSFGYKVYLFRNLREDAMDNAYAKISEIGEVSINSGEAIEAAREACDALDSEDKLSVPNYETLLAAEARYAELVYEQVEEFAKNFNDAMEEVCVYNNKDITPSEALVSAWGEQVKAFDELPEQVQNILKAATTHDANNEIAEFVEKYEYIAGKYGDLLGEGYNFLEKDIQSSTLYNGGLNAMAAADNTTMIIVIAIAAVSALAFTTLLVFKKRKQK